MLVVLKKVTSSEEALANAQCQDCLCLGGPASKGLERILKSLSETTGSDTTSTSPAASPFSGHDADAQQVLLDSLLPQGKGARVHVRDLRGSRPSDDPGFMTHREVRESMAAQPNPPSGSTLGQGALDALEVARAEVIEREAQRKRSRLAQFGGLMGSLKRCLAKIRHGAALNRVDDLLAKFETKLQEAVPLDPKSRGRRKLLAHLGTNHEELTELSVACYGNLTVVPSEGNNGMGITRGSLSTHLEARCHKVRTSGNIMEMDPFPGAIRPEHWSLNGSGRRAHLGLITVVGGSTFPEPNPPRDQYAGSVITYVAGVTFIRFGDDTNAFDQAVKGHGTVRLCGKGMYAVMEKQDGVWVYHPCLPADSGAALETFQFVRLAMRRVDGTLITQWEHDRRLAKEEVRLQEMDEVAAVRRDLLIACVEVSDQGERELPHEIQIAIGLHIGEYDQEPADQQPVYADPLANELLAKSLTKDEKTPLPQVQHTSDGQRPTA